MTEAEIAAAVAAKLTGSGTVVYDNPLTQKREFWENGLLTLERPRAGCDGTFYREWGTYPGPHDRS